MENEIIKRGRPRIFNSAEEMQEKIDNYFNSCFKPLIHLCCCCKVSNAFISLIRAILCLVYH